jgi:hypothetical protein
MVQMHQVFQLHREYQMVQLYREYRGFQEYLLLQAVVLASLLTGGLLCLEMFLEALEIHQQTRV